jgi:hypothetical protein
MKKRIPKSLRKFIRNEKARIRRQVLDLNEQEDLINKLYDNLIKKVPEKKEIIKDEIKKSPKNKKTKAKAKK